MVSLIIRSVAVLAAQESEALKFQVVTCGKASVKYTDYEGRAFTGVLVEVEAPHSGLQLEASAVTATWRDGTALPPAVFFTARDPDEILTREATGAGQLLGLEIGVGGEVFRTRALALERETRLTYTFKKTGKVVIGFLFPERAADMVRIDFMPKEATLVTACR
jgi:hypothetical protein